MDDEHLETQTTGSDGTYIFEDLEPGTYEVEFTAPDGYGFSAPNQGDDDTKDSDAKRETVVLSEEGTMNDDTVDAGIVDPKIDIDTDSNNNRAVGDGNEDDIEEIASKRIFLNLDDDDKNGVSDLTQTTPMGVNDKDLALTTIDTFGVAGPLVVKLTLSDGLHAWGTRNKDNIVGTNQHSGVITFTDDFPDVLYVEGIDLGEQTAKVEVLDGTTVLSTDIVHFQVEQVVWPYASAGAQSQYPSHPDFDHNQGDASNWEGVEVAAGWYTTKTLIDYIMQPGDTGSIATRHPDLAPVGSEPTDRSTNGPDSKANQSHGTGTLTFEYKFDRRGGNQYGYVQAHIPNYLAVDPDKAENATPADPAGGDKDRTELGFISNSGIKFAGKEVNIIDTEQVIALARDDFDYEDPVAGHVRYVTGHKGIDTTASVDIRHHILGVGRDFGDARVTQLMSGVVYDDKAYNAAKYAKMPDFTPMGAVDWVDFRQMLHTNAAHDNGGFNTMEITINGAGLTVKINGNVTYQDASFVGSFGAFDVQSHWGSGVIYRNMDFQ